MQVKNVDVIQAEAPETQVEFLEERPGRRLSGEIAGPAIPGLAGNLGREEIGIAGTALKHFADHDFVRSALVAVSGVQVDDPAVESGLDQVFVIGVHHAHGDDRKLNPGFSERPGDEVPDGFRGRRGG